MFYWMSCVKFAILRQCIIHIHPCLFFSSHWWHCSLHSFLEIRIVIIIIKRKECTLRGPYRTRARARVMGEMEEVQEQMKADMEAMKEKMATMMEAMLSMKKIMEVNAAAVAATSAVAQVDLTPTSGLNQINRAISDMVGQRGKELGSTSGPYFVQVLNKHSFLPYGLAPNHTSPMFHTLPMRMSTTLHPFPLRANNPKLIMHMSLNPWGRHVKYPAII